MLPRSVDLPYSSGMDPPAMPADAPRHAPMYPPRWPAFDLLVEPNGRGRLYREWQRIKHRLTSTVNVYALAERGLKLGPGVYLGRGVLIDWAWAWLISIGEDTIIAPHATVLAHDASTKRLTGYTRVAPVTIGARVFVGAGAIVLAGVTIGDDAIVAAGAVVRHDVPIGTVVAGNPARAVATTAEYVARHQEMLADAPRYGREYSVPGGATIARKLQMREELAGRAGYVR